MNKKNFITSICLLSLITTTLNAQESEDSKDKKVIIKKVKPIKKVEKKVIVIDENNFTKNETTTPDVNDNNSRKNKKITVLVDGDKVTINGKPVEQMNDDELVELQGNGDHLKLIAPYLRGNKRLHLQTPAPEMLEDFDMQIEREMDIKMNKALLGVVTAKDEKGAKITTVSKESAAEKAGLKQDDIITKVNDDKIENSADLTKTIGKYAPDEKVKITYIRDGKTKTTDAILTKNNAPKARVFSFNNEDEMPMELPFPPSNELNRFGKMYHNNKPKVGFKIQDIEEGNGVKILDVAPETPAAKAGLQKDDILIDVNGEALKNVDDLKTKFAETKEGDVLKIKFTRNGATQNTEIKFPKKLKTADL